MKKILLIIPVIFLVITLIGLASAQGYCVGANYNFTCGESINQSCTFNETMNCVALGGMPVTGNNITVNCNGHSLTGIHGPTALSLIGGDSNITIKNCHFNGWGNQIDITNSDAPNIIDNVFYNFTTTGINDVDFGNANIYRNAFDCEDVRAVAILIDTPQVSGGNADIQNNTIINCGVGIELDEDSNYVYNATITNCITSIAIDSKYNFITKSKIVGSTFYGIYLDDMSDNNNITYSNITDTVTAAVYLNNAWYNILDHLRINNVTGGSPMTGIDLSGSDYNNITNNYIYDAHPVGIGLYYTSENNTLENNTIIRGDNLGSQIGIDITGSSSGNQILNNNISNYDNSTFLGYWDSSIYLYGSSDNTNVSRNFLNNTYQGVFIDDSNSENIDSNKITCSKSGLSEGITLATSGSPATGNTITSNNMTYCNVGIYGSSQAFLTIQNNRITDSIGSPSSGIFFYDGGFLVIDNNYINNMSTPYSEGLYLYQTLPYSITNNVFNNTYIGISLNEATGTLGCDNNTITNMAASDLYVISTSGTFTNTTTNHGLIDVLDFENISLKDINSYPTLPSGKSTWVVYNITNTSDVSSFMDLNISYDDSIINESTLLMWAYRSSWNSLINSTDKVNNIVYANNMTTFSLFAPLYTFVNQPPVASLGNPSNGSVQTTSTVKFGLKCTDDLGVSQLQLWWGTSGSWSKLGTKNNPGNNTWWNYTLNSVPNGIYTWGAWCNDTMGQENWSDNYTFTVNKSTGGGGGGGISYCGDGTCNNGETTISCPADCPSTVCCKYSCFLGCSYQVITLVQCNGLGGSQVDNSKCGLTPSGTNQSGTNQSGTGATGGAGTCGNFNWWIIAIIVGIIIFLIIKNKKNK